MPCTAIRGTCHVRRRVLDTWYTALTSYSLPPTYWPSHSGHHPDTGLFILCGETCHTHLVRSGRHFTNDPWCSDVHPRDHPRCEAVISDVPYHKAVATESIHELARQAGDLLFLCVRPCLILSLRCSILQTFEQS